MFRSENISLIKNHTVLDFGCGEGHYTIPDAKVVEERGKVYAVDKNRFTLDELNMNKLKTLMNLPVSLMKTSLFS